MQACNDARNVLQTFRDKGCEMFICGMDANSDLKFGPGESSEDFTEYEFVGPCVMSRHKNEINRKLRRAAILGVMVEFDVVPWNTWNQRGSFHMHRHYGKKKNVRSFQMGK